MLQALLAVLSAVEMFLVGAATIWPNKRLGFPILILGSIWIGVAAYYFFTRHDYLNVDVTLVQSSAGDGSSFYQSFVRITNLGAHAGAAKIIVYSAFGGKIYGEFSTKEIPGHSTLQLSNRDIESGARIAAPQGVYTVSVSGKFEGAVEHIMFNSANNTFANMGGVIPRSSRN